MRYRDCLSWEHLFSYFLWEVRKEIWADNNKTIITPMANPEYANLGEKILESHLKEWRGGGRKGFNSPETWEHACSYRMQQKQLRRATVKKLGYWWEIVRNRAENMNWVIVYRACLFHAKVLGISVMEDDWERRPGHPWGKTGNSSKWGKNCERKRTKEEMKKRFWSIMIGLFTKK